MKQLIRPDNENEADELGRFGLLLPYDSSAVVETEIVLYPLYLGTSAGAFCNSLTMKKGGVNLY